MHDVGNAKSQGNVNEFGNLENGHPVCKVL